MSNSPSTILLHFVQIRWAMRIGPVAIIMTVIPQVDLQDLADLLKQRKGFINGCLAHGGEAGV